MFVFTIFFWEDELGYHSDFYLTLLFLFFKFSDILIYQDKNHFSEFARILQTNVCETFGEFNNKIYCRVTYWGCNFSLYFCFV